MSKKNNKEVKTKNNNRELQQQNTPKAIVAQVKASAVFTGPLPPPQIWLSMNKYHQVLLTEFLTLQKNSKSIDLN